MPHGSFTRTCFFLCLWLASLPPPVSFLEKSYFCQDAYGQIAPVYSISAGLDYPGIGPIHANLAAQRRANVLAINDDEAIEAAYELTKLEGIIPALESAHALGALKKLKFKPEDVVVLTVSGRGDKDIETYLSFNEEQ